MMNPFTVFIPVYNEEKLIVKNTEKLVEYLDTLNTPYEIIIGSNGSTDRTIELGEDLQRKYDNLKFFHINEKAPGTALKKGISLASYENIISVDMDLSVDLDFIRRANTLLTDYDLVVGSKRMGAQKRSFLRKIASASFVFSSMVLLGLSFDDYSLAAKAYRKKVLKECIDRIEGGTFYVVEVLYYASKNNYTTVQIPAPCQDDRKSRFNLLHEGVYRFGSLFKLWLSESIKRNFSLYLKFLLTVFLPFIFLLFSSCKKEINERRDISVTRLAVDPKNSDILYAATDDKGVFKNSDRGKSWSPINRGLKNARIRFLTVDPSDSNTLYIGTYGGGVYLSEDGGASWKEINEGLTNVTIDSIVFDPSDPNTLYLLTIYGGVFKSNNRGKNWISFSDGLTHLDKNPLICLLFPPSDPPIILLGRLKGMFKRGRGDNIWVPQKDLEGLTISSLAYDSNKDILYAGIGSPGKVFKSIDKGKTWYPVSKQFNGAIDSIVVDPFASDLYAIVYSVGIFKSTDQGASWKEVNKGLSSKDVKAIAISPEDPETLYTGLWGGGVFISTNRGEKWSSLNERFPSEGGIDLSFLFRIPAEEPMQIKPPKEFYKCNVCHGWTDPLLNSEEDNWLVSPTPRDWGFTVKRMNALYQDTMWPSTKDALTESEEVIVTDFLNKYYPPKN